MFKEDSPEEDIAIGSNKLDVKNLVILIGGSAKEDKYKKIIKQLGGKHIEDLTEKF
jgi:hypothetical protein